MGKSLLLMYMSAMQTDCLTTHPLLWGKAKVIQPPTVTFFWKTQCVCLVLKRKEQLSIILNLVISYFLERFWQIHFLKPFSHIEGILHRNHENRIHYKLYSCWSLICMLLLFLGLRTKEWSCQQPSYFYRGLGVITESLSSVAWVIGRYFPF